MNRFETSTVADVMQPVSTTVSPHDKIEAVSQLMNQRQIHSVPVVNQQGACIGIITSTDLVRYAAIRPQLEHAARHGFLFDAARYQDDPASVPDRHLADSQADLKANLKRDSKAQATPNPRDYRFDEAGFLIVLPIESVSPHLSLLAAADRMVEQNRHHLLVLDAENHTVGIVSTMDILKRIARTANEK